MVRWALDVPLDRLFVVPGNHDIERNVQRATWESLRRDIAGDPDAYSRWLAGEDRGALRGDDRRDRILERQQAFWAAVTTGLGRPTLAPTHSPHGRLGYRQAVMLPGLSQPLHVVGLDTAWLAGDDGDTGQLRLTEHQVSLLTTTDTGEPLHGFRLALMHHRFADLADGGDARRLLADRVDLLLHGHQHEPTSEVLVGPDHQLLVLATGCLYDGDEGNHYPNACQVIDLALDEHAAPTGTEVRFRGWSERGMFWGDDALLYETAHRGVVTLHRGARGWLVTDHTDVKQERAAFEVLPALASIGPGVMPHCATPPPMAPARRQLAAPHVPNHVVTDEAKLAEVTSCLFARRWIGIFGISGSGNSTLAACAAKQCVGTMETVRRLRWMLSFAWPQGNQP